MAKIKYVKVNSLLGQNIVKTSKSSIHCTGSITGMIKLGFWHDGDTIYKCGSYYYNMSV